MATLNVNTVAFVEGLNRKFENESPFSSKVFSATAGRKYDKVIARSINGDSGHVHAFVERSTGYVYKAASWAKPAPQARYTSVGAALESADLYGSYLYKR